MIDVNFPRGSNVHQSIQRRRNRSLEIRGGAVVNLPNFAFLSRWTRKLTPSTHRPSCDVITPKPPSGRGLRLWRGQSGTPGPERVSEVLPLARTRTIVRSLKCRSKRVRASGTECGNIEATTEYLGSAQSQCVSGTLVTSGGVVSYPGETVVGLTPVPASGTASLTMNQLGTVYATKRRRRNGKR